MPTDADIAKEEELRNQQQPPPPKKMSSGRTVLSSVTVNTESINLKDGFIPTGKGGFTTTARYESSKPLGRDTFTGRQSRGDEKKRHKQPLSSTSPGGTTSAGGNPVSRRAANLAGAAAPPNEDEKAEDERELSRENLDHQRRNLTSRDEKKKKMKSGTPLQTTARGAKSIAKSAGSTIGRVKNQLKNPFKKSTTTSNEDDEYSLPDEDDEGDDEDAEYLQPNTTKSKKKKKKKKSKKKSSKSSSSPSDEAPSRVSVLLKESSTGNTLDFRELSNSELGIDLEARKKYKHHQLNPHHPTYGSEDPPTFNDPFLATWYVAIKTFLETMIQKDYRDKEGKPLLWNVPSVPTGKPMDEPVVVLLFHYITSEEAYPLLKSRQYCSFTATHSDQTIIPNTIEMARRALGDTVFYALCLGDVVPFAYLHESSPQDHCEEDVLEEIMVEWRKVLNVLLKAKGVKIAIGAKTAQDRFAEVLGRSFNEILKAHPDKFVSAAKIGEKHASPPHPQALYDIRKLSNMDAKLEKAKIFFSALVKLFDPNAPDVEFFDAFEDQFSTLIDLCRRAYLDGCCRGGTNNWELTKAALERKKNKQPAEEGDEERIANFEAFETGRQRYFDMVRIRNELARQIIFAGDLDGDSRRVVENHKDYDDFKSYFDDDDDDDDDDKEDPFNKIMKVAKGLTSTYQKYLTELKEYKQTYQKTNVVSVGDESILVVDGGHNSNLWMWYLTMIGYDEKKAYGLKVFQYPDSAQYKDMKEQGATFHRELYAKAEEIYIRNKNVTNTSMGSSRHGLLGGLSL